MIDDWMKLTTLVGAIIAAVVSVWSLVLQLRAKSDRIRVAVGPIQASTEWPYACVSVVSQTDHAMKVADFGFIKPNLTLLSIPIANIHGNYRSDEVHIIGSLELPARNSLFECGIDGGRIIGVFAMTTAQHRPTITYMRSVGAWTRLRIWCRLRLQPWYNQWD